MTIAHQPAMTEQHVRARPPVVRSPHGLVPIEQDPPAWTVAKIVGLVAVAALGTSLAPAILAGGTLFALANFG